MGGRTRPQYDTTGAYIGYRGTAQDVNEQVRREEALRASDDLQREALRIARASIWSYDAKSRETTQSPDVYHLFGYDEMPASLDGRIALRHPDDRQKSQDDAEERMRLHEPFIIRYRLKRADGSWAWVEWRGVPQLGTDGQYTGYRGTLEDVDEQVRREEALRDSDDHQREALHIARADVWTWDAATRELELSGELFRQLGYETLPSTLEQFTALRHPDDRERAMTETNDAMRERKSFTIRYRLARADGSYAWVEVRGVPQFDADGRLTGYRGTRQDVDDQVQREAALRESDALQREALEIAHADFWAWDRTTRALDISGNLLRHFGHESPPAEAAGHVALRHPDDRERSQHDANEAVRARQPYTSRYRMARTDGSWARIEVRGVPVLDTAGDLIGYRGTRQDVDEQVRREAELRASDDRRREALQIARAELWTRDLATNTIVSSGEVYRLFGYEHTPTSRAESHALRHPENEVVADRVIEEAVKAREPYVVRYRMARSDGSWGWVEGRGIPEFDAEGNLVSYRGTRQDVDEQVRREEELREALKMARAGFWYHGRGDSAPWWSPELYEMVGLPVADMPAASAAERHPDDRERVDQVMREAVYAHQPYTVRYRVRHTITREGSGWNSAACPSFPPTGHPSPTAASSVTSPTRSSGRLNCSGPRRSWSRRNASAISVPSS